MRFLLKFTTICLLFFCFAACLNTKGEPIVTKLDTQGHRGARGLAPENTIPAFKLAMDFRMKTLELDVVISKDSTVIVSHEPWFNEDICLVDSLTEKTRLSLFSLTHDEIKQVDCGSKKHSKFPQQKNQKVYKPSLREVIIFAEQYAKKLKIDPPHYNIEIKSSEARDSIYAPFVPTYVELVLNEIKRNGISLRTTIQSFDIRALKEVKLQSPTIKTALLDETVLAYSSLIDELGYEPDIYSPYYLLLRQGQIDDLHLRGIQVIPWTVNDETVMKKLIRQGVDGIITDYPDRLAKVIKE